MCYFQDFRVNEAVLFLLSVVSIKFDWFLYVFWGGFFFILPFVFVTYFYYVFHYNVNNYNYYFPFKKQIHKFT